MSSKLKLKEGAVPRKTLTSTTKSAKPTKSIAKPSKSSSNAKDKSRIVKVKTEASTSISKRRKQTTASASSNRRGRKTKTKTKSSELGRFSQIQPEISNNPIVKALSFSLKQSALQAQGVDDLKNYDIVLKRLPGVVDIGGGITRPYLERLPRQELRDLVSDMKFQLEYYKAENYVLDHTVLSLEKRDMEIEKALPVFKFDIGSRAEGQKVIEKITDDVCEDELSSDEENTTGIFTPFIPATDIDSQDSYFDGMSEKSKLSLQEYLHTLHEVAPSNYDAIFHRYGDLVKPSEDEWTQEKVGWEQNKMSRYSLGGGAPNIKDTDGEQREQSITTTGAEEEARAKALLIEKTLADALEKIKKLDEQDPDFPDFIPRLAKPLRIEDRLRFGEIEEEILRESFDKIETHEILKANRIIVYTDTFMKSYKLLKKISEILQRTIKNGYHPLTGKMKAEDLMRFRRRMKNMILSEETKLTMIVNEIRRHKNKVDKQVRDNKELGESIQAIDYDQLRISNLQYQHKIDEQHEMLKQLKIITASQFEKLKNLKLRVHKKVITHTHLLDDIKIRGSLRENFERSFEKNRASYQTIREHNNFLQKRLRLFKAPSTMDYMNYKKLARKLEKEVFKLTNKIEAERSILQAARLHLQNMESKLPPNNVKQLNEEWLRSIKHAVVEEKLAYRYAGDLLRPLGGSIKKFLGKRPPGRERKEEVEEEEEDLVPVEQGEMGDGKSDSPPRVSVFDIKAEVEAQLFRETIGIGLRQSVTENPRISVNENTHVPPPRESFADTYQRLSVAARQSVTGRRSFTNRQSVLDNIVNRQSIVEIKAPPRQSLAEQHQNDVNRGSIIGNMTNQQRRSIPAALENTQRTRLISVQPGESQKRESLAARRITQTQRASIAELPRKSIRENKQDRAKSILVQDEADYKIAKGRKSIRDDKMTTNIANENPEINQEQRKSLERDNKQRKSVLENKHQRKSVLKRLSAELRTSDPRSPPPPVAVGTQQGRSTLGEVKAGFLTDMKNAPQTLVQKF